MKIFRDPKTPPLEILYVWDFPKGKEAPYIKNLGDQGLPGGGGLRGRFLLKFFMFMHFLGGLKIHQSSGISKFLTDTRAQKDTNSNPTQLQIFKSGWPRNRTGTGK